MIGPRTFLRPCAMLMGPADGGDAGGAGGGMPVAAEANDKPQTIDEAMAEMERREQEREAARKRKAAQRANLAKLRGSQDDAGDDDGDDEPAPRRKAQAEGKPKPKARQDEDDDGDGTDGDDEDDEDAADKARARRKTAKDDDDDSDDDAEDDDDDEDTGRAKRKARDGDDSDDGDEATDDDGDDDDDDDFTDLDGQKLRIPKGTPKALVDAVKSMSRDLKTDYTRKTQELSQGRTFVEERYQATEQAMQQVQRAQQAVVALAQRIIGNPPDAALAQEDPQRFVQQKALYDARVAELQGLTGESNTLTQRQQQLQQQRAMQSLHEENDRLVRALPALAQPENRRAFMQEAVQIAARSGFTPQDVAAVGDHRMLHLLGRLMFLERAFAQRGAAETSVRQKLANVPPKALRPGNSSPDAGKGQKRADARKAFMQSRRTMQDMKRYISATED